jgi:hypothetical protein
MQYHPYVVEEFATKIMLHPHHKEHLKLYQVLSFVMHHEYNKFQQTVEGQNSDVNKQLTKSTIGEESIVDLGKTGSKEFVIFDDDDETSADEEFELDPLALWLYSNGTKGNQMVLDALGSSENRIEAIICDDEGGSHQIPAGGEDWFYMDEVDVATPGTSKAVDEADEELNWYYDAGLQSQFAMSDLRVINS